MILLSAFNIMQIYVKSRGLSNILVLLSRLCQKNSKIAISFPRCLKITEKVSINIASEPSYAKNDKKCPFFENLNNVVKRWYQKGYFLYKIETFNYLRLFEWFVNYCFASFFNVIISKKNKRRKKIIYVKCFLSEKANGGAIEQKPL